MHKLVVTEDSICCLSAHECFTHNSQKMEITQVSISIYPWWANKENVLYSYYRTFLSHRKEWSTEMYYKLDDPQECHS